MPKGTISANHLSRSIIRHVVKKKSGIFRGAGYDYQAVEGRKVLITAGGFADESTARGMTPGELAEIIAENNLATSGAVPEYMNIYITAGEKCSEEKLRKEMSRMTDISSARNISIIGGNTAYSGDNESYSVTVSLMGFMDQKDVEDENPEGASCAIDYKREARPGDRVLISGYAGHFGATMLIRQYREQLRERFSEVYLDNALMKDDLFRINPERGMYLIHDTSYGGIYRTLYDIAEWTGMGVRICHENISVRQDTIEVCEYLKINPYMLMGIGSYAGICHAEELDKIKTSAAYKDGLIVDAGELTDKKEKIIYSDNYEMKRFLVPYTQDEIYNVKLHT